MKLQISYDFTSLSQALEVAKITAHVADILEVGTSLIFAEGANAIKAFRTQFPDKVIRADAKIISHSHLILPLFFTAGANQTSVLAGATSSSIQHATTLAHANGSTIALDLIDAASPEQSVVDASILEVDVILFHRNHESKNQDEIIELWQNVRGNTQLPMYIKGKIDRTNITQIINLKPQGIVIGNAIIKADDPAQEAQYFKELITT